MSRGLLLVAVIACRSSEVPPPPTTSLGSAPPPAVVRDAAPASAAFARLSEVFKVASSGGADIASALAALAKIRKSADPKEVAFLDKAEAVVRELAAATRDKARLPGAVRAQHELLRVIVELYPDDVDLAVLAISSIDMLSHQVDALEDEAVLAMLSPVQLRREARALATALSERAPADARAWRLVGETTPSREPIERMRAYARCAKLDPTLDPCAKPLAEERDRFVQPFCTTADMHADLAWFEGSRTPLADPKRVAGDESNPIYVAATPRFTREVHARVQAYTSRITGNRSDGRVEEEILPALSIEFRDQAAFNAWKVELFQRDGYMVLMRGRDVVAPIHANRLASDFFGIGGIAINKLCARIQSDTLPPDLAQ